jgi:hypothetical protein
MTLQQARGRINPDNLRAFTMLKRMTGLILESLQTPNTTGDFQRCSWDKSSRTETTDLSPKEPVEFLVVGMFRKTSRSFWHEIAFWPRGETSCRLFVSPN